MSWCNWLIALTAVDAAALTLTKSYYENGSTGSKLGLACALYALAPYCMYKALQQQNNVGTTNLSWNVLSTIIVLLIGYFVYKENVTSLQCLGVGLGIFSLYCISAQARRNL